MKRKMKRVLTMVLALALCFALACPTLAAEKQKSSINVMWMDSYVEFTDAMPEIRSGRTMIPIRAFMECTGASVDYQDKTVILTTADATISFCPGETAAQIVAGDQTTQIEMDVAPYVSGGRTYVPLRFFSQALGYDVLWDAVDKTAVILDAKIIVPALDQSFTVLNGLLAANAEDSGKTFQTKVNAACSLKLYDETASKSGSFTLNVDGLSKGMAADMKISWDLFQMKDLLIGAALPGQLTLENLSDVMAVAQSQAQVILDGETGMLYCTSPAFGALCRLLAGEGQTIPANAWISTALGTALTGAADAMTVGSLIYQSFLDDTYGVQAFVGMSGTAAMLAAMIGDDCFTRSGSSMVLDCDLGLLLGAEQAMLKLTLDDNGSSSGNLTFSAEGVKITMDMTGSKTAFSMNMSVEETGVMAFTIKMSGTTQPSSAALCTALPANAEVIDLETLLPGGLDLSTVIGLLPAQA